MQSTSHLARIAALASLSFAAAVMPFNAIGGIPWFGELAQEAAFYALLPFLALAAPQLRRVRASPGSLGFVAFVTLSIIVSIAANVSDITTMQLKGRYGVTKLLTSGLVLYFGFLLMFATNVAGRSNGIYRAWLAPGVTSGLFLVLAVAALEAVGTRVGGPCMDIYMGLSQICRGGAKFVPGPGRLSSLCFEPSFLALYLGFASLWVYYYLRVSSGFRRLWWGVVLACCLLLLWFSGSRTAHVLLAGFLFGVVTFPFLISRGPHSLRIFAFPCTMVLLVAGIAVGSLMAKRQIVAAVVEGESISNVSRLASNVAAARLLASHPLSGVGFGQYAFHAVNTIPEWGWRSYEVVDWFTKPDGTWPPVYSLPLRIGAEAGIVGLLAWYGPLTLVFVELTRRAAQERARTHRGPAIGLTLMLGMMYVFLNGVGQDSYRQFGTWIVLGLTSAYVTTEDPETYYKPDHSIE